MKPDMYFKELARVAHALHKQYNTPKTKNLIGHVELLKIWNETGQLIINIHEPEDN